jgi:NADPH:quinone reductase-like Zn-dependent oxidoreductase
MQALQLVAFGSPEKALKLANLKEPKPSKGEVLIKVEGSGINYADILAVQGLYKSAPKPPSIIGYDVVGKVVAVGELVNESWVGKRVTAMTRFGGYSSKVVTSAKGIVEIDDSLSLPIAATIATQGATAWYASKFLVQIEKGSRVLVHSAAGGVGNLLVQIAKNQGAEVVAMAGSPEKIEKLKSLGADFTINYRTQDYKQELLKAFGKKCIDISFNPVGGSTIKKDMKLLNNGGRLVSFGAAEVSGKKPGFFTFFNLLLKTGWYNPLFLMAQGKSIIGLNLLPVSKSNPELVALCMKSIAKEIMAGNINPLEGKVFEIVQYLEAYKFVSERKSQGKVVLKWS